MKKVAILLALFCMLTVTASAAYIPEDVISENRDGRQLIVKTYMLPPDADPSGLVEEPFEVEGYSYHHLETVKEEQTFEDSKSKRRSSRWKQMQMILRLFWNSWMPAWSTTRMAIPEC